MWAGVDEAGRGSVAGPVVAAAVILPATLCIEGINDSKNIPQRRREKIARIIEEEASWSIGVVGPETVDAFGILFATTLAMIKAVTSLIPPPSLLLVDALSLPLEKVLQIPIIRGDALCACISAASIIAKVKRDKMMADYDTIYPEYGFARNKGYLTPFHASALRVHGPSPLHRRSFLHEVLGRLG